MADLTIGELHARFPRIPPATIRYACRTHQIEGARLAGRVWLIPATSGDKWARRYSRYGSLRRRKEG